MLMDKTITLAYYHEKDYKKILDLSNDRDQMPPTWKKWKKTREKAIENLREYDITTVDVIVLPGALKKFCKKHKLPINKSSRAAFISSIQAED